MVSVVISYVFSLLDDIGGGGVCMCVSVYVLVCQGVDLYPVPDLPTPYMSHLNHTIYRWK